MTFSAVVPVRNGSETLNSCLAALREAGGEDTEIVVVDDASDDDSPRIADRYADTLIRLDTCSGASAARNRGAHESTGDIIVFVDSDVVVPEHTFVTLEKTFRSSRSPDAVQGLYAEHCPFRNAASQYKNLYYHFIWTRLVKSPWLNSAATFFLAVKRLAFLQTGGFDTRIVMPTVEDAEWGHRFVLAGKRILQSRDIQVVHLRKYTVHGLLRYDFRLSAAKVKFLLRRMFQEKDESVFRFNGGFAVSTARAADMIPWLLSLLILPISLFLVIFGFILPGLVVLMISLALQSPFFFFIRHSLGVRGIVEMVVIMLLDMIVVDAGMVSGVLSYAAGKRY